jgi:hypothetical protein
MARVTMSELLRRLRRLIQDPAGTEQVWEDDDLQDALDNHRREARYARLSEQPTILPNGSVQYLIFVAGIGDWEQGAELTDASFNVLTTGITTDLLTGRWTFATAPNRPVRVTGFHYDLHGAAAEILEAWIAREKCAVDTVIDGLAIKRSQRIEHLQTMLAQGRRRMWVESAAVIQMDVALP